MLLRLDNSLCLVAACVMYFLFHKLIGDFYGQNTPPTTPFAMSLQWFYPNINKLLLHTAILIIIYRFLDVYHRTGFAQHIFRP